MTFPLEYHSVVKCPVQRAVPASLALFGMFLFPLLFASSSLAQISATAGTSNSGHSFSAAPPTGAFVPPTGSVVPNTGGFVHNGNTHFNGGAPFFPGVARSGGAHHHSHHHRSAYGDGYYPYAYAVPYAMDANNADTSDDHDDSEYQGGPTVFDRRGSGAASYVPPTYSGPAHAKSPADAQSEDAPDSSASKPDPPEPPQPPTTLVFKDGHQVVIENYAIVSQTLYDLTSGHPRKIALADLDLPATERENDDHGVTFQLPPSAQAN
jgi:hypothetical protein